MNQGLRVAVRGNRLVVQNIFQCFGDVDWPKISRKLVSPHSRSHRPL